ncbi:MAG: phosphoglycerate kinase [Candidatus Saccharimonadales bacterium]
MFTKKTIEDVPISGKTVLVRTDFNVPIKDGKILDTYRIKQALPTIKYLLDHDAKLILISHLGRPDGQVKSEFSLRPLAPALQRMLGVKVEFAKDCIGKPVEAALAKLEGGGVVLCENLRFHPEEEKNSESFAKQLSKPADLFVQDGFGVVHRKHASTDAITHYLPSVSGFLLKREVDTISEVIANPSRPLMAIIGGAKIADKLDLIKKFIEISDIVAIGGAMGNTFLSAQGVFIGDSLVDSDDLPLARDIISLADKQAKQRRFIFVLPRDVVVAEKIESDAATRIVDFSTHVVAEIENYPRRVPHGATSLYRHEKILDIGPFSGSFIAGAMQQVSTVVWNGTMGVTEVPALLGPSGPFAHGTELIVDALIGQFGHRPYSLVGGGDTVGYIESRGLIDQFNHVSTGGGASLELMAGRKLPGVEALEDK